jgi:hypothetical protein
VAAGRIAGMSAGWSDALRELAARLERTDVEWMLVGSAATALRGAAVEPEDVDVAVAHRQASGPLRRCCRAKRISLPRLMDCGGAVRWSQR